MHTDTSPQKLSLRQIAEYNITVQSLLNENCAGMFDGFSLTVDVERGTSTLSGVVVDQADLHSKLIKIRDLGLPLLAVTCTRFGTMPKNKFPV
jgi:hypothetical protein